jgi:hypothetical protein
MGILGTRWDELPLPEIERQQAEGEQVAFRADAAFIKPRSTVIMTHSMDCRRYTFVTVGYDGETGLLRLQARSMRLYCPPNLVDQIIIVDNSEPAASNRWRADLLHQYGSLAQLVRFIPGADLAEMPSGAAGWWTQQVLKIKVAEVVRSERYVLLDAKNHLVKQLGRGFLETADGLPRVSGLTYVGHEMRDFLERALAYFGIDSAPHLDWFTRTGTPFTILTSEARELLRYVEDREGKPFASALLQKQLTEFFLYSAFLQSKGTLKTLYDLTQPCCIQIWGHTANESDCAAAIREAESADRPFMSVHRNAIANMNEKGRAVVAEFWRARGLFPSVMDAIRFLRDPNRTRQDCDGRVFPWPMGYAVSRFGERWRTAFTRDGNLK